MEHSILFLPQVGLVVPALVLAALIYRIVYTQFFHPLSAFPGPWYASSFSVTLSLISLTKREPEYLMYLISKYGYDKPIRISPTMLFFPKASALKDIYRSPSCNRKTNLYGSGVLGPPHLFSTLDGEEHRTLRKALSNAPWTLGQLKRTWESRFDEHVNLFISKMQEHAKAERKVCLSDKVAEFAADIMSMVSFTTPFGCVENQEDVRGILRNWRLGLSFFGFACRWRWFRDVVLQLPVVGLWFLPKVENGTGMGWLMCEADRQVSVREEQNATTEKDGATEGRKDFMQYCLEARLPDGSPLTASQKRAHVTLLIQAGADTTGTAMGCILRYLVTNPSALAKAHAELEAADKAGLLSAPIQFEETRQHLPFFVGCIKEGLRLQPPGTNLYARIAPKEGKVIDGHFVPAGTEITSYAYCVQRDRTFYSDDAEQFKPERWLESEQRSFELEAAQFTFGMGPRVCLGKDVAVMEMYKLLPEIVRRFDIEVVEPGRYVVDGGVAYNVGFVGKLSAR
ncbi:cytochrome P450 monooxygenase-like protein [Boeremia exigua]|uniref:cytochrome P450 monooxygenase-like protein n=1 Tax=Boeremia exigua TaxID=749465 RepID=UPI001E8ECA6B|nr:cytochrome P450 monooxygenase-like protein [Boeremia exigua]KAH6612491.1 cytochrome P450 monooxygenase-like protein [Boeremia exigua]